MASGAVSLPFTIRERHGLDGAVDCYIIEDSGHPERREKGFTGFLGPAEVARVGRKINGSGASYGPYEIRSIEEARELAEFIVRACNAHHT